MTTFSTQLGQTTPDFQCIDQSGSIYGAQSTAAQQILVSNTSTTFGFSSTIPCSATSGVVQYFAQMAQVAIGSFPIGYSATAYTASAQVQGIIMAPLFTGSTFIITGSYGATVLSSADNIFNACLYLNSAGFPLTSGYGQIVQASSFSLIPAQFGISLTGLVAGVQSTFNVCMYQTISASYSGPNYNDGMIIQEVVTNGSVAVVSPIGMPVVNSATPVLLASIPVALNSSIVCSGSWFASDQSTFSTGNGGDFFFVGQRASGNASIVNSNVPSNIIGLLGVAPYISVSLAASNVAIEIYAIGAVAKTYQFYLSLNTL